MFFIYELKEPIAFSALAYECPEKAVTQLVHFLYFKNMELLLLDQILTMHGYSLENSSEYKLSNSCLPISCTIHFVYSDELGTRMYIQAFYVVFFE